MPTHANPVERQREALLKLVQLDKSELETSLPLILEADARALEVERVSFWRLSPDRSRLRCEQLFCLSSGQLSGGDELLSRDFPRYFAALLDNPVIKAADALADARTTEFNEPYFRRHSISSLLDVPVWQRGDLAGVLCHEQVGPLRDWADFEVDFATSVAGTIAVALEAHARRHAETRYALLTSAMQDLVWDWDLQTDHIAWNNAVFEGLRFQPGTVKPSFEWWQTNVHPHDLQRVTEGLSRHAAVGNGLWRDEYRFRRGDGTWAVIVDRGVLERGPDGRALRMVGAMVDVSEQRLLQSRLALSDRMASVGTLAAGVAHEINNPLTYVGANLSYAIRLLPDATSKLRAALDDALVGVQRVQAIVQDLKSLSRPDDTELSRVELGAVIEAALGIARNELVLRAQLKRDQGDTPPVLGNAARLGQVLLNLLINAAQAIPEGRAEENEILVRTRTLANGRVGIEVCDTGAGVPPELLDQVFDPFFTTKPVGVGTGLGLSICHSIVTQMGGTLTLQNNAGRGVTARIELEAAVAPVSATRATVQARARPVSRRRGRVLVVDDVVNVGISIQRLLADDHHVDVMTSPRHAIEALTNGERWDVILCDLMMPELDGMQFVAAVEAIDPGLLSRIVLMTGGAFTAKALEFLETWPHRKVDKPCRPELLRQTISEAVEESVASSQGRG